MSGAEEVAPHAVVVRLYFEEAVKFSRSGIFQLKTAANAVGLDSEEKAVNLAGWLDFCHAHQIKRRYRITERDLTSIFDMCAANNTGAADFVGKDQFQQCLILLCSKVGIRVSPTGQQLVPHGTAFDTMVGVISLLDTELARPPEPWKPLLSIVPKMKTLFKKVAKNDKDPIGALGKSAYLVSNREFVAFYEEQNLNGKYNAKISNHRLMSIFKKSQITDTSAAQCDLKEFSFAILLLAIELGILSADAVEYYADTPEGVLSMFDECDAETGHILNIFVLELLNISPHSAENSVVKPNRSKNRVRNQTLLGESRVETELTEERLPVFERVAVEPEDGTLSSKKIREIVSKGYIYRRSRTEVYVADATDDSACSGFENGIARCKIVDGDFNPILDLLEDASIELATQVEEHQKKDIIQYLRRNAFKRHLSHQIRGLDQSTAENSVASILEHVIERAVAVSEGVVVRKNLTVTLDRRWNIGQRSTICKVGVYQLSFAIIQDLVDSAIDISIETERLAEERRQQEMHERGLIWNRTSPGWRYFRAMHVYRELYTDQTVPEIEASNKLHQTTKDYYCNHVEKIVQSHKLKSTAKREGQSPTSSYPCSPLQMTPSLLEASPSVENVSEQPAPYVPDSGLDVAWKLRQVIRHDCVAAFQSRPINPAATDSVAIEADANEFDLQLSPHLLGALKHSGQQQKDQNFLFAIKQQAKAINDSVIANYSIPSPTLVRRQHSLAMQELNARAAAERKSAAARQMLQRKQASEAAKANRMESAMKLMEEQAKVDQTIQEGKRVAECAKQRMEQKRGEIIEEKITMIRDAFESDARAGRKIVSGFSGKMQRLPSSMEQMQETLSLYTSSPNTLSPSRSPISSPNKQLSVASSTPNSRPSTSHSHRSIMHPKLWASVVTARSSPDNSRPSTSHSQMSPTSQPASPIQSFSASVTKIKQRSPSADHVSLFPGIKAAAFLK